MCCRSWNTIWQISLIREGCPTLVILPRNMISLSMGQTHTRLKIELVMGIMRHLWWMETILGNCLIKSVVHSFAKCMQDFRRFLSWASFASLDLIFWSTIHLWLHSAHAKLITIFPYPKETLHEGFLRHEWVLQSWNTTSIVWLEGILVVFVIYVGVSLIARSMITKYW